MARRNRYSGILKPLQVGAGAPEGALLLIYDIENDKLRTRTSDICQDYGLARIQFSAFFGKLNRNKRQELALKIRKEIGKASARVRIFPICEDDLKDMWIFEQFRLDADELKKEAEKTMPVLKVLRQWEGE